MSPRQGRNTRNRYYKVVGTREFNGEVYRLLRFELPRLGRNARKKILDGILCESGADALIEIFGPRAA